MHPTRLRALAGAFDPDDIGWKPVYVSQSNRKARVVPYVTNRAIMDRLDRVCGPENWRNEYAPGPTGGLLCGLSIRFVREEGTIEWITKWDGAENTEVSPVKGGLSSSMRRAAVQWGIGRYLYRMPPIQVKVDERGRPAERPQIPAEYLPRTIQPRKLKPDVPAIPKRLIEANHRAA
jgi:hypothetical protein